jgi:ELWxxDGT repeat protein
LEVLEDRTVLSPTLVADINQLPLEASPHDLVAFKGELYFAANESTHGNQLWKTDGTAEGTVLLTDINPGVSAGSPDRSGFDPENFMVVGDTLFFTANDGTHGYQLWKSDGTSEGTVMVKDLNPGKGSSNPGWFANLNGTLYFEANNGTAVRVYKTDGTADGTVEIPGNYQSRIDHLTAASDAVYFFANNPSGTSFFSSILWRTTGTTAQRITTAELHLSPIAFNDSVFYFDTAPGRGFRTYRATSSGAVTLGSYRLIDGVSFNGAFYFSQDTNGTLWKTDGTISGTVAVTNFSATPEGFFVTDTTLYLTVRDATATAVWTSDGTAAGTARLTTTSSGGPMYPGSFVPFGDELYFLNSDTRVGTALWKTDGTSDGTVLVTDHMLKSRDVRAGISPLTDANGALYFVVDNATTDRFNRVTHDRHIWISDGTADGTAPFGVPIGPTTQSSNPHGLFNFNGSLYFTANDGLDGDQFYTTDGTADGTVALTNVAGGIVTFDHAELNDKLIVSASDRVNGNVLWQTDGTPEGTNPITGAVGGRFLTNFNGAIYYSAFQPGHGNQLWKSDGTATGTAPVTNINAGSFFGFDPGGLIVFNNGLYFSATDASHGYQLWRSDGTTTGTVMITSISSVGGIYPRLFTVVNNTLFFEAIVNNNVQLWKSDGSVAGTVPVATVFNTNIGNTGRQAVAVNGTIFFTIEEFQVDGFRLWKSDGTASGTVSLGSLRTISNLVNYQDKLYFVGLNSHGYQLWKSDGTVAGTVMVTDVNPTGAGFNISGLTVADGRLLFSGNDGVNGQELWVSDGTAAGTHIVADINPGPASSYPANFTVVDGVVYFTADDGAHGTELWKVGAVTNAVQLIVPSTTTVGTPFTVTVQAINDFGGIDPNYRGTVHFTSSDGKAALPGDYTFTADDAGSHTFVVQVTLFQAGFQTLTVQDLQQASLTDTQTLLVQPGPVASFDVVATGPFYAGEPFNLTVTARDAYGNVVTNYQGTISLFSFFGTDDLPTSYTFTPDDAGSHKFSVTADKGMLLIVIEDLLAGASGSIQIHVKQPH